MYNRTENLVGVLGISLPALFGSMALCGSIMLCGSMALCGCEIVQSNIPITFDDGKSVAGDAGDPGTPAYTGTACGAGSATLCIVSLHADAGRVDAGEDGSVDAGADASDADAAASDAAVESGVEPPSEWCALRCIKRCGTEIWDCNGPLVCGVGEPPPSCGLVDAS